MLVIALQHCAVAQCVNSYHNTNYSNPCLRWRHLVNTNEG